LVDAFVKKPWFYQELSYFDRARLLTKEHEAAMRSSLVALAVWSVTVCCVRSTAYAQTGPSFPCPSPHDPLGQLICSHPDLSQADLWYVQAYQALRAQLDPGGQSKLRQEADKFTQTVRSECGIGAPNSGTT
jgi:hypothetical protein